MMHLASSRTITKNVLFLYQVNLIFFTKQLLDDPFFMAGDSTVSSYCHKFINLLRCNSICVIYCRQASKNENGSPVGTYYFGHSETILPAIVKLNLYRDEEPLKHDNFEKLKDNRKWRTSQLSPFAANLIAVLFKWLCFWNSIGFAYSSFILHPPAQNKNCSQKQTRNVGEGGKPGQCFLP